ncbi:Ank3, partial [Symbiodinium natans]
MIAMMVGPAACIPGHNYVSDKIMEAAEGAAGLVKADLAFWTRKPSGSLLEKHEKGIWPSMVLLAPRKLFCVEAVRTPGFSTAPCSAELGCSHAGRGVPQLAQEDVEQEAEPPSLLQRAGKEQLPERRCTVYEKWRMRWLGPHVDMALGSTPYGANVGSWEACLALCQGTEGCAQVVYWGGHCYGMREASNEDQDGLGGQNEEFTSAHCVGAERHCDIFLNWRMTMVPGTGISLGALPYGEFSGGWFRCMELCKETRACEQVTYTAEGRCYGMSARTHQ